MTSYKDMMSVGLVLALFAGVHLTAGQTITKDSGCGTTLGCYDDCTTTCNFAFTWKTEGNDIHFNFKALRSNNEYIALGFAPASSMYSAGVLECVVFGGQVKVYESHNAASSARSNTRLTSPEETITSMTGSLSNGILECDFKRTISGSSDTNSVDLNTDYYLLMAKGTAATGHAILQHTDRLFMGTTTDFQAIVVVETTTTTATGTTPNRGFSQASRGSLWVLLGMVLCTKWISGFHV